MSSFVCEKCGAECIDTAYGYITGCGHYPSDVALLFIAEDYLRQHWDMDSVPLCYIKERLDKVRSEGKARLADRTLPHKGISARSPDSDRMTSGRGEREPLKSA